MAIFCGLWKLGLKFRSVDNQPLLEVLFRLHNHHYLQLRRKILAWMAANYVELNEWVKDRWLSSLMTEVLLTASWSQ